MNNKKGFTLVELSVVIVIISIMLSTVLISRSLIVSAKNNKIQEEFRTFHGAVVMFFNQYDCFPGDCTALQIPDLMPFMPNYVAGTLLTPATSACTTPVAAGSAASLVLNSGAIDSTAKRTCMMLQLQASGYINGLIYVHGVDLLTNTVAGRTIPYAKVGRQSAWDYRIVTGNVINTNSGSVTVPQANGLGGCSPIIPAVNTNGLYMWCGFHELVLRNANIAPLLILQDISTANSTATYSIPSSQAFRLDLKFDDGLPYSGNISGTRNAIEAAAGTSTSCTTLVGAETVGANLTPAIVYQINNNIGTGCMTSYLIN